MIDIKDIQGTTILSVTINEGSVYRKRLMSEDYITLRFNTDTPINLERGCYTHWNGIRYEIVDLTYPTYNTSTGGYEYELRFDVYYWKWKNKILFYDRQNMNGGEAGWHLTRTPQAHLDIICSNLKALDFNYNGKHFEFAIDSSVDQSAKLVSYDNINIIDALTLIAQTWEAEWWVEDNIIHLGRCEYNTAIEFELGKNVQSMSRSESNDNYATRIYAFGSDRNLPESYRNTEGAVVNGIVQKRLMLPKGTSYIDAYDDLPLDQAVESVVIFDDVYPRRIGTLSGVHPFEKTENIEDQDGNITQEKYTVYRYKDTGLTFLKDYIIPGRDLRIVFTSGPLNGMEFGVTFNPEDKDESDPQAQLWEIVRNEDYGQLLPADRLIPENGNEYILSGFDTSYIDASAVGETYLSKAEKELKERAQKYVEKSKEDPSIYDCAMNVVDMITREIDLNVGDRVKLINPSYFTNGRQSRIYGFEKHLDGSQISYTVGNSAKYSRLAQVENEIKEIVYQGNAYSGSGGGVYVIGSNDSTRPTDRNVFSALRSLKEFLSKQKDDIAQGLIKFLQGAHFSNFIDSMSAGMGAGIMPDGRGQFQTLEVRGALRVLELIYNRIAAEESDRVFTEAGTVDYLEKIDDTTYRLTMRKEWENDFTAFREGDVLRGIVNNLAKKGEYATSWLRVLSVNTTANTITVSMYPDTETGTGANIPPTELMVLQRWGNTFDTDRQSTWYLSSREGRIVWLTGVTKPILEEHNYSSFYGKPVHLSIFEGQPIDYNEPYLYVKGLIAENLIKVDHLGHVIKDFRDRGLWVADPEEPYRNMSTLQDDVWHYGAKWRCLVDLTTQEPTWNATHWQQIEGSKEITCELYPTNGEYFYADDVDFILHWDVKHGYININGDIQAEDVEWTRDSGDIASDNLWAVTHLGTYNDLHITNEDIGQNFDQDGVTFKVRIFVRDGAKITELQQTFGV